MFVVRKDYNSRDARGRSTHNKSRRPLGGPGWRVLERRDVGSARAEASACWQSLWRPLPGLGTRAAAVAVTAFSSRQRWPRSAGPTAACPWAAARTSCSRRRSRAGPSRREPTARNGPRGRDPAPPRAAPAGARRADGEDRAGGGRLGGRTGSPSPRRPRLPARNRSPETLLTAARTARELGSNPRRPEGRLCSRSPSAGVRSAAPSLAGNFVLSLAFVPGFWGHMRVPCAAVGRVRGACRVCSSRGRLSALTRLPSP